MSYHMEVSNGISYYSMISSIQICCARSDSKENLLVPHSQSSDITSRSLLTDVILESDILFSL